jgi:hypothetical protein
MPKRRPSACGTRRKAEEVRKLHASANTARSSEETKPSTTDVCPLLFDLTSLQREANGRFGFSAKATLGLAQALVREAQGAHLPAYRQRAHLPEDYVGNRQAHAGRDGSRKACTPRFAGAGAQERLGESQQTNLRYTCQDERTTSRSSRRAAGAQDPFRTRTEDLRPGRASRFLAVFYPCRRVLASPHASHRWAKDALQDRGS